MTTFAPKDGQASTYASMDSNKTTPANIVPPAIPPTYVNSRDPSLSRGRAQSATSPRNASPRGVTPGSQSRPKQSIDLDRRPSVSYGHHRQTSIVNGVQHSRNVSLLSISTASPLSPARTIHEYQSSADDDFISNGHSIRKVPSASALQNVAQDGGSARKPERMRSVRAKRSEEQDGTQTVDSKLPQSQTIGEYALHHLYTSFMDAAESKIERYMAQSGQYDLRVENICGPGVDSAFDQLLTSLGHVNRHKPKTVIDSVMLWRMKKKNDHKNLMEKLCPDPHQLHRLQDGLGTETTSPLTPSEAQQRSKIFGNPHVIAADTRCQVATYILSRALVEIISQTTTKAMNAQEADYAYRMEGIVFHHLEDHYVGTAYRGSLSQANMVIRGQLLGVMSGLRLEEVAKRFATPLAEDFRYLSVKTPAASWNDRERNEWQEANGRTPILLQSMRWLKFATQPTELWTITCTTLYQLSTYFAAVHGKHIKHAYADLFEHALLPLAATGTIEFDSARWKDSLNILRPKVSSMLNKADHWPHVYPLHAVLLCVSPADIFAKEWLSTITSFQIKNRDRSGRSHVLKAICRLVWRYIYRAPDSPMQVGRKLDEIVKHVFQSGRRYLVSTDPIIADPLIQLIRFIGYKHQDICFRTIVFPLMNQELLQAHGDSMSIELLDPERTVIGIRAFLAIMSDLEKGTPPPFPTSFECDTLVDPLTRLNITHRRTRSLGFAVSAGRTERLSRPIVASSLNDDAQGHYVKFCQILGTLTKICDRVFGGEAVLNEKIASATTQKPRAEAAAILGIKREEVGNNAAEVRQNYYDLLHVAVEALPRCLSPALPISELVSLLCTGTAHSQPHIAASSAQSLIAIARQSYAQVITLGFARFIFNFDDKYATVSDGGLLGPGHIESTLKLYVELLQIWIDDLQQKTKQAAANDATDETGAPAVKPLPLDLSGILALVDEVESHGLFFLCSPSHTVRGVAVNVLRLVTKFDVALGKPCKRIISILEGSSEVVIDANDERLTLAERSRLQKGLKKSENNSTLVELCSSEIDHDANLWFKIFPNLVRKSLDICFSTVALTREIVCKRLSHALGAIDALAQTNRSRYPTLESAFASSRFSTRSTDPSDIIIEQWKLHLIFACTTMTNVGKSQHHTVPNGVQHVRKSSKSSTGNDDSRLASASELFPKVIDYIFAPNAAVRDAAVTGLGATNATIYQVLLESMQPYLQECLQEAKGRTEVHQRTVSSPRRSPRTDMLRLGVTHLLSLTVHLLKDPSINEEEYVRETISDYAKHLRMWLGDSEIQGHFEYHKLRTHFCTFIEGLYDNTKDLKEALRWLSFQGRLATFTLMENWCGFSPNERQLRENENHFRRSILDREHDSQRGIINSAIEKEKNELQITALSAMASLCAGQVQFIANGKVLQQFDMRRMLNWINAIFDTPSDRTHSTGRKALQNLIVCNPDNSAVMAHCLQMCYVAPGSKSLASYFEVIVNVLIEHTNVQVPFWKVLCAGLYTLGNTESSIRMKSARLLRRLEERQGKTSRLQDLDIRVSDKTTAVYKLAQFDISCRLAKQHSELAFHVFSEFSAYYIKLEPDHQRNMVSGMLPWIQTIELQLDPQTSTVIPTTTSYMLLVNLFEITVRSKNTMHNEIQVLWQALATGPHGGNVQLILDFIISLCLDRREQNFVNYVKQIVVFLAGTAAGARVVEYLLMQIQPKTMVAEKREAIVPPADAAGLPYIADLNEILPSGTKQSGVSLGHLSMILLVDLIVTPDKVPLEKLVVLLQVILVSWDQYTIIVQEQARELLVHLIHELVISKVDSGLAEADKEAMEEFIELLRSNDPRIVWAYEDSEIKAGVEDGRAVCPAMGHVIDECVKIFSVVHPTIREEWGATSMLWATSCAVRHVACRSFQIFRCTSKTLDQQMLADMLARLSNTIADEDHPNFMVFSLEILTTLRCIISKIEPHDLVKYPQLFWTTVACLDTIYEPEFQEGLSMLSQILTKLDLSDPAVLRLLEDSKPAKWEGSFPGVHALLYKGMRSSKAMTRTLQLMTRLIKLPSHELVGGADRLLFTILLNLPRFLQTFDDTALQQDSSEAAEALANAAESQNYTTLGKTLLGFARGEYRRENDFMTHIVQALQVTFFGVLEFQSLIVLLGMLNNSESWFKIKTLHVLDLVLKDVDMKKPEIASQGPDMITPLLRLLQTEHCQQALQVLDNVIDMAGTALDNKHLRMSMAGPHSNRAVRKEYSNTRSLHGIPEESGWSIPMPAFYSKQTRSNVQSVFHTLAFVGDAAVPHVARTPEVEFHRDDEHDDSFFFDDRTTTMASEETHTDGNMGELAMKLDSLDDFFEDDDDDETDDTETMGNGSPRYHGISTTPRDAFYDHPLMQRSYMEPALEMNPGAFAQSAYRGSPRPISHNRSITSPGTSFRTTAPLKDDPMSGDEAGDDTEPFSDDDLAIGRARTADEPFHAQNTIRPAGFRAGWRSLRRLTSSSGNREIVRSQSSAPMRSPRMPKLPAMYLSRDPASGEL